MNKTKDFLDSLVREFKLRNNSELTLDMNTLDFSRRSYSGYNMIITIGDDSDENDGIYDKCKLLIQN